MIKEAYDGSVMKYIAQKLLNNRDPFISSADDITYSTCGGYGDHRNIRIFDLTGLDR